MLQVVDAGGWDRALDQIGVADGHGFPRDGAEAPEEREKHTIGNDGNFEPEPVNGLKDLSGGLGQRGHQDQRGEIEV